MPMPDPGATTHVQSLEYLCTFSLLPAGGGPVTFAVPDPVRFTFTFETGRTPNTDGSVTVTWDYSWFTQAAVEGEIASALDSICTAVATMLSLPQAQVQAAVLVRRVWTIAPNVQGPGVGSGTVVQIDRMGYPTIPAGASMRGTGTVTTT